MAKKMSISGEKHDASSSEFNLNGLGVVIDEDLDFCRGYGEDTNKYTEKYFEGTNYTGAGDEDIEEDFGREEDLKAPEMPEEFYAHVDNFLKRPPPKLKVDGTSNAKNKNDSQIAPSIPMFPKINTKQKENQSERDEKVTKKSTKKKSSSSTEKVINNNLLREAFAYTDQLLREAVIQEAKERQEASEQLNHTHPKSAPNMVETVFGHPLLANNCAINTVTYLKTQQSQQQQSSNHKGESSSGAVGTIRKLRNNKQGQPIKEKEKDRGNNTGDFDVTVDAEIDSKRSTVNFDDLVSNFQNGTTLKKLQKELEMSKQSMQRSEAFLRNLSMEYLNKL
mmetsp:Transcript_8142/g.11213  ORF Transcript_8142/g.11213 Transcript_8142/m.11213 type:complete len:336 (-) Transcript_8142:17-1024(-)